MTTDENAIMEILEQETYWLVKDYLVKEMSIVDHEEHHVITFWSQFDITISTYLSNICKHHHLLWSMLPHRNTVYTSIAIFPEM